MRVERKKGPVAVVGDFLEDIWVPVIGFRFKVTTKGRFRIFLEQRDIVFAFIGNQNRFVIADDLCRETENKKYGEENQTPVAASVPLETIPASLGEASCATHQLLSMLSKVILGSTTT